MEQSKKFISPGAWFSMYYPATWNEFEDGEGSFLFYNPTEWTGNFRISAFKAEPGYGAEVIRMELNEEEPARRVQVGALECAYSKEVFQEDGAYYTTHFWITGVDNVAFECSFTVPMGASVAEAEGIIASLEIRRDGVKYPAETIPVRLSEICQINEAYEWVSTAVKEQLKKDFQGTEADIARMQQLVEKGISPKKKEIWMALGIVLCVIFANEVDGAEWRTLIDGNREAPVLLNPVTGRWVDPMKLAWSKVRVGVPVDLEKSYRELFAE